jgi:hypothetical protein
MQLHTSNKKITQLPRQPQTSVNLLDVLPLSPAHRWPGPEGLASAKAEIVRDGHGGGWSRKINAWHLYTLMAYL